MAVTEEVTHPEAGPAPSRPDLRLPLIGAAAWGGGLAAAWLPVGVVVALVGAAALAVLLAARRGRSVATACGALLVVATVAGGAVVRTDTVADSAVARLAGEGAVATLEVTVSSDPDTRSGRFGDFVLARGRVRSVEGRGDRVVLGGRGIPVLLIGEPPLARARLGETLEVLGRLATPDDDPQIAAVVSVRGEIRSVDGPDVWWRASGRVREAIRDAAQIGPRDGRALIPALVDGDESAIEEPMREDFRETGLTHLLAVSGTNLTLVVGFLMLGARWAGVRGRWLWGVGALGTVGFILLARTEPSVVRAAAMGVAGLIAMGSNGRQRGMRALGLAVTGLLLIDPWLATSPGFALSVLATAGILFLAPGWRDAIARWLPRGVPAWVAEAVTVPLAAQVACTPVVAALSGQVSLVAVVANLLAAPVVGPATVLGLLGGLIALVWVPLGRLSALPATWCGAWLAAVASHGADLPTAAIDWAITPWALTGLTVLCAAGAWLLPWVLRRPWVALPLAAVLVVALFVRPPSLGWPPAGWVFVACDVGQGDGLVLNAGDGQAVVVDTGPEPDSMTDCLHALDVEAVPLVVLTHFHADHIGGVPGVFGSDPVGQVWVTGLDEPAGGARAVAAESRDDGLRPEVPALGAAVRVGEVTLQVLGVTPADPSGVGGDGSDGGASEGGGDGEGDGSGPNDASVVLLAVVRGVRILLTGDVEPDAQRRLAAAWPALSVDVLKVPHHGSRYQDLDLLTGLGAEIAVVSVGADNDYGHPAPETLDALTDAGLEVQRTDQQGDVAVIAEGDGTLGTDSRH